MSITSAEMGITIVEKSLPSPIEARVAKQACLEYIVSVFRSSAIRSMRPLSESRQTQVYVVDHAKFGTMVVKRHCGQDSFRREVLALTMLEALGVTPRLTAPPDYDRQVFVTEYLSNCYTVYSEVDFASVAYSLGRLHAFASLCLQRLQTNTRNRYPCIRDRLNESRNPHGIIIKQMIDVLGPMYHSVAVGDIKPEHVRLGATGCVLVDMETFSWGGLEVLDLFQLVTFPVKGGNAFLRNQLVSESYCMARDSVQKWPVSSSQINRWICIASEYLDNPHEVGDGPIPRC